MKAAPDAIVGAGDLGRRALQKATRNATAHHHDRGYGGSWTCGLASGPGANITGINLMSPDLDGKRQDILIEAAPSARA